MKNKIYSFNPSLIFPRDYRKGKSNSTTEICGITENFYNHQAFDGYWKTNDNDFYQTNTLYLDCGSKGSLRKNITTRTLFIISDEGRMQILLQKEYDTSIKNQEWAMDYIEIVKDFLSKNPYESIDMIELEIGKRVVDNITDMNKPKIKRLF